MGVELIRATSTDYGELIKPPTEREFIIMYRQIYLEGQVLFDEFNPCDVQDGECWRHRTVCFPSQENFCCDGCKYLKSDGCHAEALWCKLWICPSLRRSGILPREFVDQVDKLQSRAGRLLRRISGRHDLSDYIKWFYRSPAEEFEKAMGFGWREQE